MIKIISFSIKFITIYSLTSLHIRACLDEPLFSCILTLSSYQHLFTKQIHYLSGTFGLLESSPSHMFIASSLLIQDCHHYDLMSHLSWPVSLKMFPKCSSTWTSGTAQYQLRFTRSISLNCPCFEGIRRSGTRLTSFASIFSASSTLLRFRLEPTCLTSLTTRLITYVARFTWSIFSKDRLYICCENRTLMRCFCIVCLSLNHCFPKLRKLWAWLYWQLLDKCRFHSSVFILLQLSYQLAC